MFRRREGHLLAAHLGRFPSTSVSSSLGFFHEAFPHSEVRCLWTILWCGPLSLLHCVLVPCGTLLFAVGTSSGAVGRVSRLRSSSPTAIVSSTSSLPRITSAESLRAGAVGCVSRPRSSTWRSSLFCISSLSLLASSRIACNCSLTTLVLGISIFKFSSAKCLNDWLADNPLAHHPLRLKSCILCVFFVLEIVRRMAAYRCSFILCAQMATLCMWRNSSCMCVTSWKAVAIFCVCLDFRVATFWIPFLSYERQTMCLSMKSNRSRVAAASSHVKHCASYGFAFVTFDQVERFRKSSPPYFRTSIQRCQLATERASPSCDSHV